MMHQSNCTKPLLDSQTEYLSYPTRPATADDFCYNCGSPIAGLVTEIPVSNSEIHFICEFCSLDPDSPLPYHLTALATDRTEAATC